MHDFIKISHPNILHSAFAALDAFKTKNNRLPKAWDYKDSEEVLTSAKELSKKIEGYKFEEDKSFDRVVRLLSFTC